jgi:hypothetical protein
LNIKENHKFYKELVASELELIKQLPKALSRDDMDTIKDKRGE